MIVIVSIIIIMIQELIIPQCPQQGKAAYFTTFVPYILILILSIRGFSLEVSYHIANLVSTRMFNLPGRLSWTLLPIHSPVGKAAGYGRLESGQLPLHLPSS